MPTQFPSYLSSQPQQRELAATYRQIPSAFNTQGVEDSYAARMGMNMAQAKSQTSNMVRAAENRAFRNGGKVAASFAGGDAMLPYLQQNEEMAGKLADYKLRAAQNRIQAQGAIGGQLADNRMRGAGMMMDYDLAGQNRAQQGGQFDRSLAQQAAEFRANNALRLRQQDFTEDQYQDQLRLQRYGRAGAGGGGGSLPSWGAVSSLMTAHNAALGSPQAAAYWQQMGSAARQGGYADTDVFGTGSTGGYGNTITGIGGGGASRDYSRADASRYAALQSARNAYNMF